MRIFAHIFPRCLITFIFILVVMGSESSLHSAHSTYTGDQGQYYCEVDDEQTTDCGYRSEKHKTWTTHSKVNNLWIIVLRGPFAALISKISNFRVDLRLTPEIPIWKLISPLLLHKRKICFHQIHLPDSTIHR